MDSSSARGPAVPGLSGRPVELELHGPVVDAERAWALVGDTDWLNLSGGNGAVVRQELQEADDGLPVIVGALAGPVGLEMPFEEVWTSWVRGRYFRQVRNISSPMLEVTDYLAVLRDEAGGVRPVIRLHLYGPALVRPLLAGSLGRLRERWQASLDRLSQPPEPLRQLPAPAREALDRWRQQADSVVVDRVRALLEYSTPTDLRRIRPFALADRWGLDRDETLDAMLHGVLAGALELYWSVRCIRCYGQVGGGGSLSDLADHAACPSCRIEFDNDLGSNVEVLMAPHPAVVPLIEERFCTLYPAGAPQHEAVWTLAPGQKVDDIVQLTPGRFHLGPGGKIADAAVEVGADGDQALAWTSDKAGTTAGVAAGPVGVQVENDGPGRVRVQLTRDSGQEPRVPAALLTTRPIFQRHFGHQVLARDLRLSTRAVTLLFTDLSGSTAMYEAIGDAAAYAVVRDHFVVLREAVEASRGVIVKTIGDAVMAAFDTPARATRAGLAMQDAFDAWVAGLDVAEPPGLRVGIHTGPALAVHSDVSGLDWFGGTVNLAARAESLARRGDIILTEAAAADAGVRALLDERGLSSEPLERSVKGFHGTLHFVRILR